MSEEKSERDGECIVHSEQVNCPYCDDTFCPECDPCLAKALSEIVALKALLATLGKWATGAFGPSVIGPLYGVGYAAAKEYVLAVLDGTADE